MRATLPEMDKLKIRYPVISSTCGNAGLDAWSIPAATVPEDRNQSGPYFAAFSLHIPDMRSFFNLREIVKICTRSSTVSLSHT